MEQEEAARDTTSGHPSALSSKLFSLVASTPGNIVIQASSMENSVKFTGGAVAALVAMRCAGSLRTAFVVGLLCGLFAHSLYADILRKKRGILRDKYRGEIDAGAEEEDAVI
ncbi:hypothetical protein PsorP6_006332 [Peronosclerospora sorghi]|uniref:Uncharacterized protein n=1 Tax=Peronosclerospora sorghi TaxID=230839 RepID=A0ACC0W107_9STRA|nr:hypothetical protein PsorP6_006332 [Peronosclerospora sorghi]